MKQRRQRDCLGNSWTLKIPAIHVHFAFPWSKKTCFFTPFNQIVNNEKDIKTPLLRVLKQRPTIS